MASIPTVPGSFQVQTQTAGVQADFNALDAPNRASARMGDALGDAGRVVGEVAMKLQSAVNYGIAADADRTMRAAAAEFQQSRAGRTDEDQWGTQWQEKSEAVWQQLQETTRMGPSLRRQLSVNFKDWQSSNAIEVGTMANKQRINRAVDRVGLAADEAAKDGDEHGIVAAFTGAVDNHLMLPEQAQKLTKEYLTKVDEYAARNYITNNPVGAGDFISAKDKAGKYVNLVRLNPDKREELMSAARGAASRARTEYQNDIASRRFAGEVIGDAELDASVQGGLVTGAWARAFKKQQTKDLSLSASGTEAANEFGELRTDILKFSPTDEGNQQYEKLFARAMLLPEKMAVDAIALLKEKAGPKNVLNSPVAKDAFEGIDQRFRLGLYGKFETKVEDKEGNIRTVVNPKVYESAMEVKRRVEDAARKYINDNPAATAEDVNSFVSNVQMTSIVQSGRGTLLHSLGQGLPAVKETAEQRNARLDAILAKAKK